MSRMQQRATVGLGSRPPREVENTEEEEAASRHLARPTEPELQDAAAARDDNPMVE